MAFTDFPEQEQGVQLLQRSLQRGRLAHAYLFTGHQLDELESLARILAKTLNCQKAVKAGGIAIDSCDECLNCRKIDGEITPTCIGCARNPNHASSSSSRCGN